jgi:hypothetical protein
VDLQYSLSCVSHIASFDSCVNTVNCDNNTALMQKCVNLLTHLDYEIGYQCSAIVGPTKYKSSRHTHRPFRPVAWPLQVNCFIGQKTTRNCMIFGLASAWMSVCDLSVRTRSSASPTLPECYCTRISTTKDTPKNDHCTMLPQSLNTTCVCAKYTSPTPLRIKRRQKGVWIWTLG